MHRPDENGVPASPADEAAEPVRRIADLEGELDTLRQANAILRAVACHLARASGTFPGVTDPSRRTDAVDDGDGAAGGLPQ